MNGLHTHLSDSGSASTMPESGSWKPTKYIDTKFALSDDEKIELNARQTAVIATHAAAISTHCTTADPGNPHTSFTNMHIHTP